MTEQRTDQHLQGAGAEFEVYVEVDENALFMVVKLPAVFEVFEGAVEVFYDDDLARKEAGDSILF